MKRGKINERPAAILENVNWPYFCNGSCDSLHVWFYGRVFGVGGSSGPIYIHWAKSKIAVISRQPSCIILNEMVHPIQFVFDSKVKVWEKIMREE